MPSLSPKKKFFSIPAKDSLKTEIELFPFCAISHENKSFSQMFCPCLYLYLIFFFSFKNKVLGKNYIFFDFHLKIQVIYLVLCYLWYFLPTLTEKFQIPIIAKKESETLTLSHQTLFFEISYKIQVLFLYWSAAQRQINTFKRQKLDPFYSKFKIELNELIELERQA